MAPPPERQGGGLAGMLDWRGDRSGRASTLAIAAGLFVVIFAIRLFVDAPDDGVGFLYALPVALVAVELGWRWGLAAAAVGFGLFELWVLITGPDLSPFGQAMRAVALFPLGGVLGFMATRLRAADHWFALASDMFAIATVGGRFTRLNPAWERTLGWTREELMARPYVEFIHPEDVEPTIAAASGLLEGSSEVVGFENRYATKDGEWRWLQWSSHSDGRQVYAVVKDVTERKLLDAEREILLARVEALARTDMLTGLPNRRAWEEELRRELARVRRQGDALAVAMLDLDHFKAFNDTHGHQAGDRLLATLGTLWTTELRVSDFAARYGGEEFVALLPACPPDEARAIIERMRQAIPEGQTCSAGVAYWDGEESPEALMGRADAALYEAKRAGRDRIVSAV